MSELRVLASPNLDLSAHAVTWLVLFSAAYVLLSSAFALLLVYVAGLAKYLPESWRARVAPAFSFAFLTFIGVLVRFGNAFLYTHADIDKLSSGVTLTFAVLVPAFVRLFFVVARKKRERAVATDMQTGA